MPPLAMLPAAVAVASALVGWAVGRQGRQQTDAADTRSLNIGLQQSVLIECISELSSSSIIDGRLWHSLRC